MTVTTFGTTAQAEAACQRVRQAHRPVRGRTTDGERYDAADPELLGWVHLALADSLAVAVQRYGHTAFDLDDYLSDMAIVGDHLGAANVPRDAAGRDAAYRHYRPQLAGGRGHRRGTRVPARPTAGRPDPRCPTG